MKGTHHNKLELQQSGSSHLDNHKQIHQEDCYIDGSQGTFFQYMDIHFYLQLERKGREREREKEGNEEEAHAVTIEHVSIVINCGYNT